jgi:alkyl hydroperoxide reductase subunit F
VSEFVKDVEKNKSGEIVVNCKCETNIPGIFAAGDVTNVPAKQIIVACGEGAKATLSAFEYISRIKKER